MSLAIAGQSLALEGIRSKAGARWPYVLLILAISCGGNGGPSRNLVPVEYLMAGTPYATPLYRLDADKSGPTVLILAGVHGDEPGSWLAAEEFLTSNSPSKGTVLVLPRANRLAVEAGVRSTPELGDLNRLYGSTANGLPMTTMASGMTMLSGATT